MPESYAQDQVDRFTGSKYPVTLRKKRKKPPRLTAQQDKVDGNTLKKDLKSREICSNRLYCTSERTSDATVKDQLWIMLQTAKEPQK